MKEQTNILCPTPECQQAGRKLFKEFWGCNDFVLSCWPNENHCGLRLVVDKSQLERCIYSDALVE